MSMFWSDGTYRGGSRGSIVLDWCLSYTFTLREYTSAFSNTEKLPYLLRECTATRAKNYSKKASNSCLQNITITRIPLVRELRLLPVVNKVTVFSNTIMRGESAVWFGVEGQRTIDGVKSELLCPYTETHTTPSSLYSHKTSGDTINIIRTKLEWTYCMWAVVLQVQWLLHYHELIIRLSPAGSVDSTNCIQ